MNKNFLFLGILLSLPSLAADVVAIRVETGVPLVSFAGNISVEERAGNLHSFALTINTPNNPGPVTGTFTSMEQGRDIEHQTGAARLRMLPGFNPTSGGNFRMEARRCSGGNHTLDFQLALDSNRRWVALRNGSRVRTVVMNASVDVANRKFNNCFTGVNVR